MKSLSHATRIAVLQFPDAQPLELATQLKKKGYRDALKRIETVKTVYSEMNGARKAIREFNNGKRI